MGSSSSSNQVSSHIPDRERLKLWVRSGGRCAFCNKYLLQDELTAQWLNLAEMAHNVGRQETAGSPRGDAPLDPSKRNLASNLLLLCKDHHTLIDDRVKRGEYSVEYLTQLKLSHEARIEYLTGMGVDQETTVVRMIGDIRGSAPDVSAETVRQVVLGAGRYPRFPLSYNGQDLEIDLRNLPGEGTSLYWQVGKQRIDEIVESRLNEGIRRDAIRHLSVFALTRIPLLIYFGFRLDDKVPTDLYQKHRSGGEGWDWNGEQSPVQFAYSQTRTSSDDSKVAIVLSLSGSISFDDLPQDIQQECTIYTVTPEIEVPHRDILRVKASLENFTATFQRLLSELEVTAKHAAIHLFAAIPVTAAVACGRSIMRNAHPTVVVYDRVGDGYEAVMEIAQ